MGISSSPARSIPRRQGDGSDSLHGCVQFGLGSPVRPRSTREQWSASQRSWHINALEMQAFIDAVRDFLPHLRSRVVRLMCDNAVQGCHASGKSQGKNHFFKVRELSGNLKKCQGNSEKGQMSGKCQGISCKDFDKYIMS